MVGVRGEGDDAVPVGQVERAAVGAVAPLLDARDGRRGEVPEEVARVERGTVRKPQRYHPGCGRRPRRPGRAAAQLPRRQGEDLTNGVVEGADRGEPGRERDLGHGQPGRLDEHPRGLRPLCPGERQRSGTQLGEQLAFDLAGRVPEPGGQSRDALPVDDPVADEAHRAGHGVGAGIPLGRSGAGVGPAPLAGPNPACWQAAALG